MYFNIIGIINVSYKVVKIIRTKDNKNNLKYIFILSLKFIFLCPIKAFMIEDDNLIE